jgi:uncharacterized protein
MAGNNGKFHEDAGELKPETMDRHRAIVSLMEELEAIDWYDQRIDAASDDNLRAILAHNRDEEKEHASMILEWLRRKDAVFDRVLGTYLFTEDAITELEEGGNDNRSETAREDGSLGIGSLNERNAK